MDPGGRFKGSGPRQAPIRHLRDKYPLTEQVSNLGKSQRFAEPHTAMQDMLWSKPECRATKGGADWRWSAGHVT